MKTREIRDLIDFIAQSGLNEVNIETEELKLKVKKDADVTKHVVESAPVASAAPVATASAPPSPVTAVAATPPASSESPDNAGQSPSGGGNYVEVKSPMIGTFYRSPNPESDVFVNVGDSVSSGQTVCIIEAMKLFNEIESDVTGKIVKVLVEDASPVEYDQPLFLVDPS